MTPFVISTEMGNVNIKICQTHNNDHNQSFEHKRLRFDKNHLSRHLVYNVFDNICLQFKCYFYRNL